MKRKKGKPSSVLFVIGFIVGLAFLFYPTVANLYNTWKQQKAIEAYNEGREADNTISYEYEWEKARAYNDNLWPTPDPEDFVFLKEEDPTPEYMECLNLNGDGIMGYVSVPKINVELPIYHGTDEKALLNAAGHLEGTSLPIGGTSTHSVISAHRGVPDSELFTDLDLMEIGDHFFLYVLDETLCYEVDQIVTVQPDNVSDLVITDGEDYCTLLTCTPYGINTERLLVRGHRVPYDESIDDGPAPFKMTLKDWLLVAGTAVAVTGIIAIVRRNRKTGRQNKNGKT